MKKPKPLNEVMSAFHNDQNLNGVFRFNEFSEDIEFIKPPDWHNSVTTGKAIEDRDLTKLRYYLTVIHSIEPSKQIAGEACYLIACQNSYHPVKTFLESEKWDGTPRIDEWLIKATGCDDNVYTRQVSSKFLIATVNRVYRPGCKFDHMLILEGEQGIGKSTLIETLADRFYLDTTFEEKGKDLVDSMRTAMIVEISELAGMSKKEVEWMKSFITRKVDRVRLAYAMLTQNFKRKSVLVGTFNPSGNNTYLRDDTGNRRFWPIECKKINIEYLKDIRGQLWAEALARKDEKYYIDDPEALFILKNLHEDRELESPSYRRIKKWLDGQNSHVSMDELIVDALGIKMEGKDPKELLSIQTTIGIIMRRLKWIKGTNDNRHIYYRTMEQKEAHAFQEENNFGE